MLGFRSHNVCEDSRAGKRRDKITDSSLICPTTGAQARCIHQQERWELKISREYCPALCIGIGHISHRWKLECIQQLITFMYISVVPLWNKSSSVSDVNMWMKIQDVQLFTFRSKDVWRRSTLSLVFDPRTTGVWISKFLYSRLVKL